MKNKNKSTVHQLQQGDVLLLSIPALPTACKPTKKDARGIVLAEGEATGHYHGIDNERGVALMEGPAGERFLVNDTGDAITIKHQEHKPVSVPPGIWQIGQVREKDWFADMVRPVID